MNWIPVTERLPEAEVYVLVAAADKGVWMAHLWRGSWIEDASGCALADVTHWMPKPAAPA